MLPLSNEQRCAHWNQRGYGRCVRKAGHDPVSNGSGVSYEHQYATHPTGGTLDVKEALPAPPTTDHIDDDGERLAAVTQKHRRVITTLPSGAETETCAWCYGKWPCDVGWLMERAAAEREALEAEVERLAVQVEAACTINNRFADQSGRDGQELLRKDAAIRALQARVDAALWLLNEAEAGPHHEDARGEPRNVIETVRTALQEEADGA